MPALPTLRQLEYAVAVADHKSFHRAARACHVTPARALARRSAQLEALLDARLFERDRRNVWSRAAGEDAGAARARACSTRCAASSRPRARFQHPLRGRAARSA